MTDEEWLKELRALAVSQSKISANDFRTIRAALAATYALVSKAGRRPAGFYDLIEEADLARDADLAHDRLDAGDWSWELRGATLRAAVRSAAARVRALDRLLKECESENGPPSDIEREYYCDRSAWFVIPRLTARLPRHGHGGRATFQQRGVLDHRLLPKKIGSYTIELNWLADIALPTSDDLLGAAMFETFALSLDLMTEPNRFLANDIVCPDAAAKISAATKRAHNEGCVAMAWPELTMRPDVELVALRDALETIALSDTEGGRPAFTLAGSWHVANGDVVENVAPVLDAFGQEVLRHAKSRLYADNDVGFEDAESSYRIPVLVTQEQLIAFGICKDFCDIQPDSPYPTLNVDLIVIGSIGNDTTMAGHQQAAKSSVVLGARAFVVQQDLETKTGKTGWVLPPSDAPDMLSLPSLRKGAWSTHRAYPPPKNAK